TAGPRFVPTARVIGNRVIARRILSNPKNRGDNVFPPRVTILVLLRIEAEIGWIKTNWVDPEHAVIVQPILLLAQFDFGRRSLSGRGRTENCRDRAKKDGDSMSECSWFHRKQILRQFCQRIGAPI